MIGKNRGIIELREGCPFRPAPAALAKQTFVHYISIYNSFEPAKRHFAGFWLWKTF